MRCFKFNFSCLTFFIALLYLCASSTLLADEACHDIEREVCNNACSQENLSARSGCQQRCLEMRCGPDSWSIDGSTPVTDGLSETAPPCTSEQHTQCSEECRKEFGRKFKECKEGCLSAMCDPNPIIEDAAHDEEKLTCLEFESRGCVERCKDHSGQEELRCRRGCLSEKCPGSGQSDMMKEALDPGRLRCDRCQEQNRAVCKQNCFYGVGAAGQAISGAQVAGHLGCEQLCMSSVCSKSCPNPLPLPF